MYSNFMFLIAICTPSPNLASEFTNAIFISSLTSDTLNSHEDSKLSENFLLHIYNDSSLYKFTQFNYQGHSLLVVGHRDLLGATP